MFYLLLYPLHGSFGAFNVFRYITFRTAMATMTALLVSLLLGPALIRGLRQIQIGQEIRAEGPSSHQAKRGTPTMGGLLIILAVVLPTLLWADPHNSFVWIAVGATLCFGAIGFIDDYIKVVRCRNLGLRARTKFLAQITVALLLGGLAIWLSRRGLFDTTLVVPFFKTVRPDLGWFFLGFAALVLVGSANAVNLTDGLDGLAIGLVGIAGLAFTLMAYLTGNAITADYLNILFLPDSGELTIFGMSLVGACLGFLWFNAHPAQVFMGDTGSMALGGALAGLALLLKKELLLIIVGGVFVLEAASVLVQIASYRWRGGKRVFRMAPIHHHFELSGWAESRVVIRFWILGIMFALFSLSTFKIR
jgi:phospho-N-acetylmuramoyl-pentapeptide-transferase